MKFLRYIGNALLLNKGHRKAGILLWVLICGVLGGTLDYISRNEGVSQPDYVFLCTQGDFEGARDVQDKYYADYCNEYAAWHGGGWNAQEARMAQEKYHSIAAYIFAQEIASIYYGEEKSRDGDLISRLMSIPTEGAPLAEGCYGNGMFYANDAGVGEPLAIAHVTYQSWVSFYNDRCEQVLDLALANGNKEFARRIAGLYKSEVVTQFEPDTTRGGNYCIATVSYNASRREMAIQRTDDQ